MITSKNVVTFSLRPKCRTLFTAHFKIKLLGFAQVIYCEASQKRTKLLIRIIKDIHLYTKNCKTQLHKKSARINWFNCILYFRSGLIIYNQPFIVSYFRFAVICFTIRPWQATYTISVLQIMKFNYLKHRNVDTYCHGIYSTKIRCRFFVLIYLFCHVSKVFLYGRGSRIQIDNTCSWTENSNQTYMALSP